LINWTTKCEEILTQFKADNGIPFDYGEYDGIDPITGQSLQLPDTLITYTLLNDDGLTWSDGKETSHEPRIQVSLFYRDKSTFLTMPTLIETAFIQGGFLRVTARPIPYQKDTNHYGWCCDFRIYEKR